MLKVTGCLAECHYIITWENVDFSLRLIYLGSPDKSDRFYNTSTNALLMQLKCTIFRSTSML